MKKTLAFFALLVALYSQAQQTFEVMTKKPTPGSVITIEYMPRNTVLQGIRDFEATAYLFEGAAPRAVNVPLKQEGGLFRGSVKTADSTRAVFFAFAKDEKRDANADQGYYTPLYTKEGNEVPGADSALAMGLGNWGGLWGLKGNAAKAAEFNKLEFANASSREKFSDEYLAMLAQSKDSADKQALKVAVEKLAANPGATEADLAKLQFYYSRYLKDKPAADAVTAKMKEQFPNGTWKRRELVNTFYTAKTLGEKEAAYRNIVAGLAPLQKDEEMRVENMKWSLVMLNADSANWEAVDRYLAQMKDESSKANVLNSIAWKLAGEGINKKPRDVKRGLQYSAQSMAAINAEKKTKKAKPPFYTEAQYLQNLEGTYQTFADTYAVLLYHNGQYNEALATQQKAADHFKGKNIGLNEALALITEKAKGEKAALALLENYLEQGKYNEGMKAQMKRLYLADGKSEAAFTSYISGIEERAYNRLKAEVAKQMLNLPAPQFALKNMEGKEVSLASLKGKVVVVDFWATWCGPCVASFPAMQTAVNKFKNNPNVAFVFVDTWENDSNRVQKVTDFIAKNKYNFNVLYDETKGEGSDEFTVVKNFEVDGIPTKFVIDRNGNIRFKTVGFNGNADETVAELTAMIDMAAAGSGEPMKKGF